MQWDVTPLPNPNWQNWQTTAILCSGSSKLTVLPVSDLNTKSLFCDELSLQNGRHPFSVRRFCLQNAFDGPKERQNMKNLCAFLALLLASPLLASAQNLEVSGGYAHISGDGGLDGFNIGAADG